MKRYFRIHLGRGASEVPRCLAEEFVGVHFGINQDLAGLLPEEWRAFNREFVPVYLKTHPGKSRIAAGLACGSLWTVAKGIKVGDIVLSPDADGTLRVAEVVGDYVYRAEEPLPHRRPVRWLETRIDRNDMSDGLRRTVGVPLAVCLLGGMVCDEIERLLGNGPSAASLSTSAEAESTAFAMEKYLEEFLVENWAMTELGRDYDIYEEDGRRIGQQYLTDTGPLDILAISKDRKTLLVVELKKGKASDAVVGQTLRYMGFVREELAGEGQTVAGAIIALDDDSRLQWALSMVPSIRFYRYEIRFQLVEAGGKRPQA